MQLLDSTTVTTVKLRIIQFTMTYNLILHHMSILTYLAELKTFGFNFHLYQQAFQSKLAKYTNEQVKNSKRSNVIPSNPY